MRFLIVLTALVVATGCGGGAEKPERAAATPSPTVTASPTPSPLPASERAVAELQNFLDEQTQDVRRYCVPVNRVPAVAIAADHCDYRDGPMGGYLLFKTRAEMRRYFNRVWGDSKPVVGAPCRDGTWTRKHKKQGRFALRRDGDVTLLIWSDDSERVIGTLRSKVTPPAKLCAIWKESA